MNVLIQALMASLVVGVGASEPVPSPAVVQTPRAKLVQAAPSPQKRVSVKFSQAPLSEVLAWLSKQGLNTVAAQPADALGRRFSLDVNNVPLDDVMHAIADAYGGSWSKRGEVHVLSESRGLRFLGEGSALAPRARQFIQGDALRELKVIGPEIETQIKRAMELGPNRSLDRVRVLGPEIEGQLKRALEQAKVLELKELKGLQDMKLELKDLKDLKELKGLQDMKLELKDLKSLDMPRIALRTEGVWQIERTLTSEQRALHEKQGYLKLGDLTAAQRKMLGDVSAEGSWSITIKRDGKTLSIRGG